MLDVILYGYDSKGRLTLEERPFHSRTGLAHFFASVQSIPWKWAEVTVITREGIRRVARYSADDLRVMVEGSGSGSGSAPTPN